MLSLSDFHPYQHRATDFVETVPQSMLWLFMGAGKSIIACTAVKRLMDTLTVNRALVIAPRRVAETVWRQEVEKWSHVNDLKVILLRGSNEKKMRDLHRKDGDIFVINFESIPWLVNAVNDQFLSRGRYPPWNMLILDEIDRLKNASGKRYQLVEKLFPYFTRRVGLTGTPASNGYGDLHGQYKCIDDGRRLGANICDFRARWMKAGYAEQSWELMPGAAEQIEARIQDITLSMSAEDYLNLPDYVYHVHWIDLAPKIQAEYDRLEKEMFAQLDRHSEDPIDGEWTMEVHSALSARAKCRQLANGAVLNPDNSGTVMLVHDEKLEMLDSIVHEAAGKPLLIAYMFRHDMHRIKARYEKQGYRIGYIGPGTKDVESVVAQWNAKQYHMMLSHPACLRGDTEVLTEKRGWVRLGAVLNGERVFDGIEYVSHEGCVHSGFKRVIDVFGVKMTPGHKLLMDGVWREAKDISPASVSYLDWDHVYDLVNCGPRHRFLIRNAAGDTFISHNSIGHGLNLQDGGNELVWFSPTDNLAYYQQYNARLRRQGQTAPNVNVRLILARKTVDEPMMKLLERKAVTADELRVAIEEYRKTK